MTYRILLHPRASRELEELDEPIKSRIRASLRELRSEPEKLGKPLKGTRFLSLRVGDYRAIYEVSRARLQVIVLLVGHRRDVYDDFSKLI